jgi:hypothetical protein
MRLRPRTVLALTFVAALVVFAAVQDRVTAAGARDYAALQRAAATGLIAPVTIEQVMAPVLRRSVRAGLTWAVVVVVVGLFASRCLSSGFRRPGSGAGRE